MCGRCRGVGKVLEEVEERRKGVGYEREVRDGVGRMFNPQEILFKELKIEGRRGR